MRHDDAQTALLHVDNLLFLGRRLSVKWYQPNRAHEDLVGVDQLIRALQANALAAQQQPELGAAQLLAAAGAMPQWPAQVRRPLAPGCSFPAQPASQPIHSRQPHPSPITLTLART